ncbi:MAG: hypothetical protein DCC75_03980 [Proteobacteria bacterium]|nr:MAG: hypothetical protein DCC75_03980 [Pseudomonadota bacterium]
MIKHVLDKIGRNDAKDLVAKDFDRSEVIIGRGSGCDLIIDSRYLSLKHARFFESEGKLYVEDLNSLAGTQVNEAPVQRQALREGDRVRLGDIELMLHIDGGVYELKETRTEKSDGDVDALVAEDLKALQITSLLPSLSTISYALILLVIFWCVIYQPFTGRRMFWSSGPIATNHKFIEKDCSSCHEGAFKRVSDDKCVSCHQMSPHAEPFRNLAVHSKLNVPCADCHMEHNGDHGLIARESKLCAECHADLKSVFPGSNRPNVINFDNHPQFMVALQGDTLDGPITKVSLDDKDKLKDRSHIKLNHKIHLQADLRTKDGRKTLQCNDCHRLAPDFKTIEPITFERDCQYCHSLEFDERLAGKEVPHGDPDVVYKFLYAEYAKLLLAAEDQPQIALTFKIRMRPGGREIDPGNQSIQDFSRAFVEKQSRFAEEALFTKTACKLCHDVSTSSNSIAVLRDKALAAYKILKPQVPARWMPASIFSHGAHEEMLCQDCHKGVSDSEETADVLLPKVEDCRECHGAHRKAGVVTSECSTCHSYHDKQALPFSSKRELKEILKGRS